MILGHFLYCVARSAPVHFQIYRPLVSLNKSQKCRTIQRDTVKVGQDQRINYQTTVLGFKSRI